jgi:hypothetical protein
MVSVFVFLTLSTYLNAYLTHSFEAQDYHFAYFGMFCAGTRLGRKSHCVYRDADHGRQHHRAKRKVAYCP